MIYRFNIEDGEENFVYINKCIQMPSLPNKQWDGYIRGNLYWETKSFPNSSKQVKADIYFDKAKQVVYFDTAAVLRNGDSGSIDLTGICD